MGLHKFECERIAIFFADNMLSYFDASYRPMRLEMQVVRVTEKRLFANESIMDDVCCDRVSADPQLRT